jgi:hypothetical protein
LKANAMSGKAEPSLTKKEIVRKFGGADELRNAVNQLQTLLYAA